MSVELKGKDIEWRYQFKSHQVDGIRRPGSQWQCLGKVSRDLKKKKDKDVAMGISNLLKPSRRGQQRMLRKISNI